MLSDYEILHYRNKIPDTQRLFESQTGTKVSRTILEAFYTLSIKFFDQKLQCEPSGYIHKFYLNIAPEKFQELENNVLVIKAFIIINHKAYFNYYYAFWNKKFEKINIGEENLEKEDLVATIDDSFIDYIEIAKALKPRPIMALTHIKNQVPFQLVVYNLGYLSMFIEVRTSKGENAHIRDSIYQIIDHHNNRSLDMREKGLDDGGIVHLVEEKTLTDKGFRLFIDFGSAPFSLLDTILLDMAKYPEIKKIVIK